MLLWSIIAVELTNSSAAQNQVVFQPTSEQAKYGASDSERLSQFSFEVNNQWIFRWIEALFWFF